MAETFYGALGVSNDADRETIRRAYREQVKEHHPDVSDDPDAPEQFKRLTTARDVLVDTDERERYDRLGHDEYVSQHLASNVWRGRRESQPTERPGRKRGESEQTTGRSGRRASDGGYDRTAWLGADGPEKRRRRHQQRRQQTHAATATAAEWQHASKAYRRAETNVGARQRSALGSLLAVLRSVGPWLLVHLIFVGSAAATSWLALSQLATVVDVSWPTLLLSIVLVGMAIFASVLHVISQIYRR